jgi:hypothetical protein
MYDRNCAHLDVSFKAADRVEYFPPLPTVIEPEGGDEAHDADQTSESKEIDDVNRLNRIMES